MGDGLSIKHMGGSGRTAMLVANAVHACINNADHRATFITTINPDEIYRDRFADIVPLGCTYKRGMVTFPNGSTIEIGVGR